MRIIAGKYKGRRLNAPEGSNTRPTSDRAREALFNILMSPAYSTVLREGRVLDLFAGTGALGLEALSRGARLCHFYETEKKALTALSANLEAFGVGVLGSIFSQDANKPLVKEEAYTLALTDPPYAPGAIERSLNGLRTSNLLSKNALIVAQLDPKTEVALGDGFSLQDDRQYGAARFLFLTLV